MHARPTNLLPLVRASCSQACNRLNTVCVPLYDSLGENAIEFITNHSEATVVFVASDKLANLAKALPKCTASLKSVVYWGEANTAAIEVSRLKLSGKAGGKRYAAFSQTQGLPPPSPPPTATPLSSADRHWPGLQGRLLCRAQADGL